MNWVENLKDAEEEKTTTTVVETPKIFVPPHVALLAKTLDTPALGAYILILATTIPWNAGFRMKKQRCNIAVALLTVLAASSIHGYNTGVLNLPENTVFHWLEHCDVQNNTNNGTGNHIKGSRWMGQGEINFCNEGEISKNTKIVWTWIASIFSAGGLIGGLMVAFIVSDFSETKGLFISGLLALLGSILQGTARCVNARGFLVSGRFIVGISAGLDAGMISMFLGEISPEAGTRAAFSALYRVMASLAILVSQMLGTKSLLGNTDLWPTLLSMCAIPAMAMATIFPFLPSTPTSLYLNKNEMEEAKKALDFYKPQHTQAEMNRLKKDRQKYSIRAKFHFMDIFYKPLLRKALLLSLVAMLARQNWI